MANPATRQQWILEELKSRPTLSYVECWAIFGRKWAKGKSTFDKDWNAATEAHKDYQIKANKAKEEASIQIEVESLKNGIKTKNERVLILQNQVDESLSQLELGECRIRQWNSESSEYIIVERPLSPIETVALRKVIRDLQSEISKIQGDYAPEKKEHEIKSINLSRIEFVNKTSK